MEKFNELMAIIHEPIKIISGDHTHCLPNNSTPFYACRDKYPLVKALASKINKFTFENRSLIFEEIKHIKNVSKVKH